MKYHDSKLKVWCSVCVCLMGLTGCNPNPLVNQQTLPQPVYDHGMILDWGRDVKSQAIQMIRQSQQYCYLDIYELADRDILQALINAHQRKVDVRVVMDGKETHSQSAALPVLQKAGVPVESLSIKSGISHIKMLLVDGKVLMGGMNFGENSWQNNDASVYLQSLNTSFRDLFLWDFARARGEVVQSPICIAPLVIDGSIESAVIQGIQSAKHSISIEAFDLSDRAVLTALKEAISRNVSVAILLDPSQYYNRKPAAELRNLGAIVRFYQPYKHEYMHAKIVDVDEGHIFIIGSANFSHQAYTFNHEGDLLLYNVTHFDKSLQVNLSEQIARGTDYAKENNKNTYHPNG